MTGANPDRHALNIAQAIQAAVEPDMVILFGSRAAGDHHEDSDIDILVVTDSKNHVSPGLAAKAAAESYMQENPPALELGIISMDRKTFDRCRLAHQHVAGQAVRHGVTMNGERLEYRHNYEDDYPNHWPETKQRIQKAEEFRHSFDDMVDANYWNRTLIGFSAQQAVENALKGWLSTFNDSSRFGHDLDAVWRKINELEDWSNPQLENIRESVQDLLDYTTCQDPENPQGQSNWLTRYADVYRYGHTSHTMTRQEQQELQDKVGTALDRVVELIHRRSGTNDDDVYPEGVKPWEP